MTEKDPQVKASRYQPLKWVVRLVLGLFIIVLLMPLIVHFGPVQKFLVDRISGTLSEKTGSTVNVGGVNFSVINGLELENLYISNVHEPRDTLLHLDYLSSSLKENLYSLVDRQLNLEEINMRGLDLRIRTLYGDSISNLDGFIRNFQSAGKARVASSRDFDVKLRSMNLEHIRIYIEDENLGDNIEVKLGQGLVTLEAFSSLSDTIRLSKLMLSEPYVAIEKMPTRDDSDIFIQGGSDSMLSRQIPSLAYIFIDNLELSGGGFSLDDWSEPEKLADTGSIDFNHLQIRNFNINADTTSVSFPLKIRSNIKSLTLEEKSGFEIRQLDVRQMEFSDSLLGLEDFVMKTNESNLDDHLRFSYSGLDDFRSFSDSIRIDADLDKSEIALSDLRYFFPELEQVNFYRMNKNRKLYLAGEVKGTINNLQAREMDLAIDQLIRFRGSLNAEDITRSESALINLYVDHLNTSLYSLSKVIPGFRPPSQFYKLGPIRFAGDIDGFFDDFVIYGYMQSDLGRVLLDTRLDLKNGRDNALYSGDIALENFDLRQWTGNDDFGTATLTAQIRNGKGLTLDKVYADLDADLEKFEFRDYSYTNISLEGEFQKNRFDGHIEAGDPNVDLIFDGQIDLSNNRVKTNFVADIRNINLTDINLSRDISSINGRFESTLRGSDVKTFEGFVNVGGLSLIYKEKNFVFDSLYVSSSPGSAGTRNVNVSSDIINASLDGTFNFSELWPALQNFLRVNHPAWADRMNIPAYREGLSNKQDFRFKIYVRDTRDYLELLNLDELRIKGLTLEGAPDLAEGRLSSNLKVDSVFYKGYGFESLDASFIHNNNLSEYRILLDKVYSNKRRYDPLELNLNMDGDLVRINIRTENILDSVGNVDIVLEVEPLDDMLSFHFEDKQLQMFSADWHIEGDNKILLGKNYLDIRNVSLDDGYRSISIKDFRNSGIDLDIENFDFELINGLIGYEKIDFTGEGDARVRLTDIFGRPAIYINAHLPHFYLNQVDYGALTVDGSRDSTDFVQLDVRLERERDEMYVGLSAEYDMDTRIIQGEATARNLVMNTFEFIIDEGISNTAGTADVDIAISGVVDDMKLKGDGRISNGTTTIDYLGARLDLGNERIRVSENFIDLTNVSIFDKFGNRAIMLGGLRHNLFDDFSSQLNMSSDRFLALDTDKTDNPMYYGTGIGQITVNFSGPFETTDIDVTAVTGPGTVLNIPVEDSYQNFDESFITFIDRDEILNPVQDTVILAPKVEGVDVEMNLTITRDAQVNMIFNEKLNDVIKGRGNGDLRIIVSREGDFNIFGNYEVESGEYLFTAWGIVAKPFTVRRGGLITWTGDPVNANLNIAAEYAGLRVPVNVFLAEYLTSASPSVQSEAQKRTSVDLTMKLTGTLYNPVVNFDLAFPELQGELRTYADNKVRTLRENEADLNEQVAGLIMFRSFLPSNSLGDNLLTSESLTQTGYNTLSEFVSNQLSYLLSGFLQEALAENGFVSGIDFEIGFSRNADVNEEGNLEVDQLIPDEIEVHFKPRFQNDRWGFDYGTSFVNSSTFTNYIIHDFVLEYYLTNDRRLKLRAYGKWDKDEVEFGNEQRYGVGINYRKEFGSLTEFQKALNRDVRALTTGQSEGLQE